MLKPLAILLLLTGPVMAADPKLPEGVTCSDVRSNVARYGKIAAYAWARLQGYSSKQVAEATKCLK